jgi:hypothetical protein
MAATAATAMAAVEMTTWKTRVETGASAAAVEISFRKMRDELYSER